ncbi:D-glycero-beta-D-manno-heptose 1,7-bisphosphate 7-phosphatase [Desulfatirhabdium butyrativorans]|uniref:D-glycero-beta-D-manno-heptose 1,7-bisphosphate 7-phosphatase n=1 Tax=Desulfatirhabdium butyrativorans TaxID=340467 RepID=UPI00068424E4|nr:D-glycero-beta-D-manno-heptose 1,7-bisphosphate 7-phosphatase [Desulfatirhabdium butyrativorans]
MKNGIGQDEAPDRRGRSKPCVFLDRDGVINHDSADYIKSLDEFVPIEGSYEAIARLNRAGRMVIVITNQSAIGRGIIDGSTLERIHERLAEEVGAAGGHITDILFCPHRPDEKCSCRKPEPGMLFEAAARHGIDLSRSVMVGDSAKDIECGIRAGCKTVLVLSGNGRQALESLKNRGISPDAVFPFLRDAVHWIIRQ